MERMTTRALILPMGLVRCFNLLFLTWYEFNVLLGLVDDGVTVRKEQEDKGIGILLHFNFFSLYEDSMLLGSDGKKEIHDKQKIDSSSAPGGLGSDSLGGGSSSGGRGSGSRSGSVFQGRSGSQGSSSSEFFFWLPWLSGFWFSRWRL